MLKAGALYFAIVVSFFIAIISASLIMLAAHYRAGYLKEIRLARLHNNVNSGINYVLANMEEEYSVKEVDLFGDNADSLMIERKYWGIYDMAIIKAHIKQDTLKRALLIGNNSDSTTIYLSDEDRPLAISGNTKITGDVVLPKSGIRQAYAEGKPYSGKQLIYEGKITSSNRSLPQLNEQLLSELKSNLNLKHNFPILGPRSLTASFIGPTFKFSLSQKAILANVKINGNIILYADSSITIKASAQLNNVQLYAPYIKIEDGFEGNCQFFATDSVVVGNNVILKYPSVIGVIKKDEKLYQPKITLGKQAQFNGILFTSEKELTQLQTKIALGKKSITIGEVYCSGFLQLEKDVMVNGKVSCNRFMMQTATTRYENFLIDVIINHKARSNYYLSSRFFGANHQSKILQWLN